ncbi:MAG: hypothetical protein NVS3B5_21490 [Sphingomicrobium sp.]
MMAEIFRRIHLPLFGECRLRRRTLDESPTLPLGYVELADELGQLHVAVWQAGQWRTRSRKGFRAPVIAWYSIERADGTKFP